MSPRTVARCLSGDPGTIDAIVARLETNSGIEPEAVLHGAEARLEGIRKKGHAVDAEILLWAVDATLDDLWASQWLNPIPERNQHGEDSRS